MRRNGGFVMQTRKLYYEDCHLMSFSARVTGCEKTEKGYLITLDATAFYPEGGGQACDTGALGDVHVLDVQEKDDKILHLCDGELTVGSEVAGTIDYAQRFERMQQHTGEHILSGILNRRYGLSNVGFHMGQAFMEVDFDGPIPPEALESIEREANEAVWQNLPVKCWYPSEEELPNVPYRSKRVLSWPVRIVEVPDFDSCACCGVHVAMTGEVGIIKIVSCIKFHQGVRLEMVCGSRAWRYLNAVCEQNRLVSQTFSAKMLETGEAAVKMSEALAAEKYKTAGLQKQLFEYVADSYANQKDILHIEETVLEPTQIRSLADSIASKCGGFAAVFAPKDENFFGYCLVSREKDLTQLGREMTKALNGRGGGKPAFQQGSVAATKAQIEAFFADIHE